MLPLLRLGDLRLGDARVSDLVARFDTDLGDTLGDSNRRAPFMGFTRAPPSNLTRRSGLELASFIKLVAARLSASVYAPYWLPVYPSVLVPSSRASSTAFWCWRFAVKALILNAGKFILFSAAKSNRETFREYSAR